LRIELLGSRIELLGSRIAECGLRKPVQVRALPDCQRITVRGHATPLRRGTLSASSRMTQSAIRDPKLDS
jgi:hypothetical protein